MGIPDRERTTAPPGFNRWLVPPAALAVQLCIGQAYETSVHKTPVPAAYGLKNPDWRPEMSTVIVSPGNPSTGKLTIAWALVGVPLAYGIYGTLTRVAALLG